MTTAETSVNVNWFEGGAYHATRILNKRRLPEFYLGVVDKNIEADMSLYQLLSLRTGPPPQYRLLSGMTRSYLGDTVILNADPVSFGKTITVTGWFMYDVTSGVPLIYNQHPPTTVTGREYILIWGHRGIITVPRKKDFHG